MTKSPKYQISLQFGDETLIAEMKKRECGFSEKIEAGGTLFHMFIVSNRQ